MFRYDTTFAFPVRGVPQTYKAYDAEMVIRNDADGKSYLYDLLDIEKKKVISAAPFSAETHSEVFAPKPSTNNISTSGEKVNGKFSLKGMDSAYLAAVERGDTEAAQNAKTDAGEGSGKTRYEIKTIDGRLMTVIDTQNDTRDFKAAEAYLKTLVNTDHPFSTILMDAQPVYVGKDLPGEYRSSEYTKSMLSKLRDVKMQAATNLDEMLLLAENGEWRENVKPKHAKDARNGWYRYDTEFAIPILNAKKAVDHYTVYGGTLLIRNDADGKSYLYDLLDIEKKKVISAASFSAETHSEVLPPKPSTNSISTSDGNVNAKFSLKGMDRDYSYSALVRKPEMRLTQIAETSPGNRADIIRETKPVSDCPASRTGEYNRCVSQEEFSTVSEGSQAVERKQQYCLRKVHTYDLQKLVLFTIIVHSNREMTTLS